MGFSRLGLAVYLAAVSPVVSDEAIFRAGGLFMAPAGNIGLPIQVWNPPSDPAFPSSLPYRVPEGKTLLLTDLYMETDPHPGAAFLLAVYVETGDQLSLLQTIQLREPIDRHVALSTPIPIREGDVLNIQFSSLTPSPQAVAWNLGARLVEEVDTIANTATSGSIPAAAKPYPIPKLYEFTKGDFEYETVSIQLSEKGNILTSPSIVDAFADPSTYDMALVNTWNGQVANLDRSMSFETGQAIPVLIAAAGTSGSIIVSPKMPNCEAFNSVLLGGPYVGRFPVTECSAGQISVDITVDLKPGQRFQPQMEVPPPEPAVTADTPIRD